MRRSHQKKTRCILATHMGLSRHFFALASTIVVSTAGEVLANDSDSVAAVNKPIESLVGDWEAYMNNHTRVDRVAKYEWGANNTYLIHTGYFLSPDGEKQPGWEGVIYWNPVEQEFELFTHLGATSNNTIIEKGRVEVLEGGGIRKHISVHFPEGVALPPDGERKATAQGAIVRFQEVMKPLDENTAKGSVLIEIPNGDWQPVSEGAKEFLFKKREKQ